ncbi:tRNA (mnm(5)s(2)U34)-methyltransferase [Streptococcus parauberis]|uniref:tRNA (mnm(5)s(2)U34)-methyltransferase n=1 Tax=Streptococcus parauberis TaxID=1348 RepID=UPI0015E19CBD|nr:class I SAM-dependent methyltransferase [Streptococcus parauberis]UWM92138.1 class I SAM-dependent methyltransferase [Streptococcus parauberis]WEM64150.1 class I SAM-dependent methyltransferase [Streptococcus parauberis]
MVKKPIQLSHEFLKEVLTQDSLFVDATMGNGNDTLYFAPLVKEVIAFDIQEEALLATRKKLDAIHVNNVQLILDGHQHVDKYTDKIDGAIFNLGYLPSANKDLVTKPDTTILALEKIIERLAVGGRIAIMVYYGHEGGQEERKALMAYLSKLNQKEITVMTYQAINQVNNPPYLVMIEKNN